MDRREFLKVMGVGVVAATPLVYALAQLPPGTFTPQTRSRDFHAIDRLSFGITPDLYTTVREIGATAFVAQQLQPKSIDDSWLDYYLQPFAHDLGLDGSGESTTLDRAAVKRMLVKATIVRALHSERQLYERVVQFWGNHFYIYVEKANGAYNKIYDDRDVVRAYAFKSFRQLLGASAHSPAMLIFLDNVTSTRNVPNENYAREMMELHTLGVEGGYSEADVKEVARCFTGWAVQRQAESHHINYKFKATAHDDDEKTVLGTTIPAGGGEADGEIVLDLAAAHPSTARFISRKLARRFVSDNPPEGLVDRLASTFQQSGGDIPALLTDLFAASEFWDAPPKLKQPFEYLVSVMRALNVKVKDESTRLDKLIVFLNQMGNVPFEWPAPNGYPDAAGVWQAGLLTRWNFVLGLLNGDLDGFSVDLQPIFDLMDSAGVAVRLDEMLDFMGAYLLGRALSDAERSAIVDFARSNADDLAAQFRAGTALLLASPAFQYR